MEELESVFYFSSAILGASVKGCGMELCDCWRNDTTGSSEDFREYRTFQVAFPDTCQDTQRRHSRPQATLTVTYQQVFSHPDPLTAGRDALKHYEHSYRQQPPDLLLLNMGLHIHKDFSRVMSSVMDAGEAVRREHNSTLLWKTITHDINGVWDKRAKESEVTAAHKAYAVYDVGKMILAAKNSI